MFTKFSLASYPESDGNNYWPDLSAVVKLHNIPHYKTDTHIVQWKTNSNGRHHQNIKSDESQEALIWSYLNDQIGQAKFTNALNKEEH